MENHKFMNCLFILYIKNILQFVIFFGLNIILYLEIQSNRTFEWFYVLFVKVLNCNSNHKRIKYSVLLNAHSFILFFTIICEIKQKKVLVYNTLP